MEKLFEVAVRSKFRFPFKGMVSVEDLWDMSVRDLDFVFKSLNSELKQVKEESLLEVKTQQDQELDMKIEIVKYVVKVKLEEKAAETKAKENKEKKQKILELLAEKQDASLRNMSAEDLQKMLEELE
jgi:hypoxanthine phosphoribosyltransferase